MVEHVNYACPCILTFIVMVVFFTVAVVVGNSTPYKPDASDIKTRRVWFWIMAILTPFISIIINYFGAQELQMQSHRFQYFMVSCVAAGIALAVYILVGLIVSKAFKTKKVGTWFK